MLVNPPLALTAKRIKLVITLHTPLHTGRADNPLEHPVIPGCNLCLHDITNSPGANSYLVQCTNTTAAAKRVHSCGQFELRLAPPSPLYPHTRA